MSEMQCYKISCTRCSSDVNACICSGLNLAGIFSRYEILDIIKIKEDEIKRIRGEIELFKDKLHEVSKL